MDSPVICLGSRLGWFSTLPAELRNESHHESIKKVERSLRE